MHYNFCRVHSTLNVTPAMEVFEDKKVNAIDEPWEALGKLGVFGRGAWRYWRLGEPEPESNWFVQELYA
jgi:hypothetical protein